MITTQGWGGSCITVWGYGCPGGQFDLVIRHDDILTVLDTHTSLRVHLGREDLSWMIDPIQISVEKVLGPGDSYQFVIEDQLEHISFQQALIRFVSPHAERAHYKLFKQVLFHTDVERSDEQIIQLIGEVVYRGQVVDASIEGSLNAGAVYRNPSTGHPTLAHTVKHIAEMTNRDNVWRAMRVEIQGWSARITKLPAFTPDPC